MADRRAAAGDSATIAIRSSSVRTGECWRTGRETVRDHVGRRDRQVLQRLGQDLADMHHLVAGEHRQHLGGRLAGAALLAPGGLGQQRGDLAHHAGPHGIVGVAGEQKVGLARSGPIGGDGLADGRVLVLGQEIQKLRPDIVALREFAADRDVVVADELLGVVEGQRRAGLAPEKSVYQSLHGAFIGGATW